MIVAVKVVSLWRVAAAALVNAASTKTPSRERFL
jgi:hypothetical protein